MKIVWSPLARHRAEAAAAFIAADSPGASIAWYQGLIERIELLRGAPEQGRVVAEWYEDSVREILYAPYRVIYDLFEDRIEIITLAHFRERFPEQR